ncbi:MAG: hypothetical protein OK457_08690 [Thaumarchaeota archaeon]|nr:hypothetical protein [Nitrososphaerota archaeon]
MAEESNKGSQKLADLSEVYELLKTDASDLLRDLLRGVSMWGTTAVIALFLTLSWIVLAAVITVFGHPYGSPPNGVSTSTVIEVLYMSIGLAFVSAVVCIYMFSRYFSLKKKYSRLFKIAEKLR